MRDRLQKAITNEPPVGDVDVDFLNGLPHAADAEQILDEDDLEKGYRIDAGPSHVVRRIEPFDFLVNEAEVNGTVDFPQDMVLRHQVFQCDELDLLLYAAIFFPIQCVHPYPRLLYHR